MHQISTILQVLKTNNYWCIEQSMNDAFKKKVYPSSIFVCSLFYEFNVILFKQLGVLYKFQTGGLKQTQSTQHKKNHHLHTHSQYLAGTCSIDQFYYVHTWKIEFTHKSFIKQGSPFNIVEAQIWQYV